MYHCLKNTDPQFVEFGEAYFSFVDYKYVKGWKRHKYMSLNIVVPVGRILFVLYDQRYDSSTKDTYQEVILSNANYSLLSVPPMVWMGFAGLNKDHNILLNLADLPHDPEESETLNLSAFDYNWDNLLNSSTI